MKTKTIQAKSPIALVTLFFFLPGCSDDFLNVEMSTAESEIRERHEPRDCLCTELKVFPVTKKNDRKGAKKKQVPLVPVGETYLERLSDKNRFRFNDENDWATKLTCTGETGQCEAAISMKIAGFTVQYGNKHIDTVNYSQSIKMVDKSGSETETDRIGCQGSCPDAVNGIMDTIRAKFEIESNIRGVGDLIKPITIIVKYEVEVDCDQIKLAWTLQHFFYFTLRKDKDAEERNYQFNDDLWELHSDFDGDGKKNIQDRDDFDPKKK